MALTVAEPARRSGTASLLQAVGIRFAYGRSPVLEDVSLDVAPGEFVALVGPNGSGKSTLLKVLLGSLIPERGIVRLFGGTPATGHGSSPSLDELRLIIGDASTGGGVDKTDARPDRRTRRPRAS